MTTPPPDTPAEGKFDEWLREAVANGQLDIDTLLRVGTDLARTDTEKVRFLVDASHIARLGMELVAKQETAVAELVKNAYDADSQKVTLNFIDSGVGGGTLEIVDDGDGMSMRELIDGFMRLSTAAKVHQPRSPTFNRSRAGRKGIGRFAAQRLGHRLVVTTQTEISDEALSVTIDWDRFERDLDLYTIESAIDVRPKDRPKGTTLRIENLRDAWSDAQIRRAYRYVAALLKPSGPPYAAPQRSARDPGFQVEVVRRDGVTSRLIADEATSIFDHAAAVISGRIDDRGRATWSIRSPRLDIVEPDNALVPERGDRRVPDAEPLFPDAAGARFTVHYFIREPEFVPASEAGVVSRVLQNAGGVRLYRNGFRVPPYGEPFDDWLRLDAASRARNVLSPIANTNFIGFVEIEDIDGRRFEETSSREGLVENDAFEQLRDFVFRSIRAGVLRISSARGRKGQTSDRPREARPVQIAAEALTLLDDLAGGSAGPVDPPAAAILRSRINELGAVGEALVEERALLRVLAGLGLTIGEFTHEVRSSLGAALSSLHQLSRLSHDDKIQPLVDAARRQLEVVRSYAHYFDAAVISNAQRSLRVMEIRDLVHEFEAMIAPTLEREGYRFETDIRGFDLFTRPMHHSEWSSVFLNMFTNSIKAIRRTGRPGTILIRARRENPWLVLEFCDTGDGIPQENRTRVFDPFFTTSSPAGPLSNEVEELTGSGLGLKIIRDIVVARDGDVRVIDPPTGYATCIELRVPLADPEEVPADVR